MFPTSLHEAAQVLNLVIVLVPSKEDTACFYAASKSAQILLFFHPSLWATALALNCLQDKMTTSNPAGKEVQLSLSLSVAFKAAPEKQGNHHFGRETCGDQPWESCHYCQMHALVHQLHCC